MNIKTIILSLCVLMGAFFSSIGFADDRPIEVVLGHEVKLPSYAYSEACEAGKKYDRKCYSFGIDVDGNGMDTRQDLLIKDSLRPVEFNKECKIEDNNGRLKYRNCKVVSGMWLSTYTGTIEYLPISLDAEHAQALKEGHEKGAKDFSPAKKAAFANDTKRNLILVQSDDNRARGERDHALWVQGNLSSLGATLDIRQAVSDFYGLGFLPCEEMGIKAMRWIADKTKSGIKLFKAYKHEQDFRDFVSSGNLEVMYQKWYECKADR